MLKAANDNKNAFIINNNPFLVNITSGYKNNEIPHNNTLTAIVNNKFPKIISKLAFLVGYGDTNNLLRTSSLLNDIVIFPTTIKIVDIAIYEKTL